MSKKKLAIIGNGMGTCRLLDELAARGGAFQYEITVFGEEQGGAYNRIMLGKVLAGQIIPELENTGEPLLHDSSTSTLIRRYRAHREAAS